MDKPQPTFKLRVRFLAAEFEAEGPPELVTGQFKAFQDLLHTPGIGMSGPSPPQERQGTARPSLPPHADSPRGPTADALFRVDPKTRHLSLRVLPTGSSREADAALLLLFGYKHWHAQDELPVTILTEALKQSGCPVTRLDRTLALYVRDHSIVRSGRGKGGRYRLTNRGLERAEKLSTDLALQTD